MVCPKSWTRTISSSSKLQRIFLYYVKLIWRFHVDPPFKISVLVLLSCWQEYNNVRSVLVQLKMVTHQGLWCNFVVYWTWRYVQFICLQSVHCCSTSGFLVPINILPWYYSLILIMCLNEGWGGCNFCTKESFGCFEHSPCFQYLPGWAFCDPGWHHNDMQFIFGFCKHPG